MRKPTMGLLQAQLAAAEAKLQLAEAKLLQRDRLLVAIYQGLTSGMLDLKILQQELPKGK